VTTAISSLGFALRTVSVLSKPLLDSLVRQSPTNYSLSITPLAPESACADCEISS